MLTYAWSLTYTYVAFQKTPNIFFEFPIKHKQTLPHYYSAKIHKYYSLRILNIHT